MTLYQICRTMKRYTLFIMLAVLAVTFQGQSHAQKKWTLQDCMEYALENNIQVRQGSISIDQRRIDVNTALGKRLPGVSAGASQDWSFGRGLTADNTYDNTNTTNTSFSLGADVTLFAGGRLTGNQQVAQLSLDQAAANLERIRDDVRVAVAKAFIEIVYDRSILDVAKGQANVDSLQVERLQALAENGLANQADLAAQQANLAKSRLSVTQANGNLKLAYLALTQLLELESPEGFEIQEPDIEGANLQMLQDPESVYASALGIKPAIRSEQLKLDQAEKRIGVAQGAYYPTLSMRAGTGSNYYTSSRMKSKGFGTQFKDNFSQYVSLNLSIPVFSRFETRNSLRSAKLDRLNQSLELDAAKKTLYKDIQAAWYNADASRSKYESSLVVEQSAMRSFELMQAKFEGGNASITDFTQSKNQYVTAQADALKNRYEYIFNAALLSFYKDSNFNL